MRQVNRTYVIGFLIFVLGSFAGYAIAANLGPFSVAQTPSETPPAVAEGTAKAAPSAVPTSVKAAAPNSNPTNVAAPTAAPSPTATLPPTATATPTVTATPLPPPTPTPRIKPPPSAFKRLQDYPRPPGDSGYGFHLNASPYPPDREVMVNQAIPLLKQLGATWVTVWAADENQVERIKPLIDNGIEVVLRLHPVNDRPHPGYVPPREHVAKYVAAGVRYFVTGNEPNLNQENSGGGPDAIARQWMMASDNIKLAGGIPMLYPMSPGGDQPHREMLDGIMRWLRDNDALDTLDGAAIAVHNRPHNKPLEVRDDSSFLEYEWIDDLVARYFGRSLPIIGTEAGYTVGEDRDRRFPKTTMQMHKDYNMAIVTGFRDGRWRDSLFAQNFWILGEFGYEANQFMADPWVFNRTEHGQDLPIVAAMKAMAKFTRNFQGEGFPNRPR